MEPTQSRSVRVEKGRLQGENLLSERIEMFKGEGEAEYAVAANEAGSFPFPLPSR